MAKRNFRVGRSRTGLGLFAIEPIKKGAAVTVYRGPRIPTHIAEARERYVRSKYMFEINSRWSIDGSSRRNLARYVNHACRPNTEAVLRKGEMVFVACRAINPDEEITLDYGREYFDLFIRRHGCRCRTCHTRLRKTKGPARTPGPRKKRVRKS